MKTIAPPVRKEKTIKRELEYAVDHPPSKKPVGTKIQKPKPVPVKVGLVSVEDDQINDDTVHDVEDDSVVVASNKEQNGHLTTEGNFI